MTRLYLDHNVSLRLAATLRWVGHDVVTARDLSLTRLSDDEQLLSAVRSGRILVTHNRRDFVLLHEAWSRWPAALGTSFPSHQGILVLDAAPEAALGTGISALLGGVAVEELTNSLLWWRWPRGWFRRRVAVGWEPYLPPST